MEYTVCGHPYRTDLKKESVPLSYPLYIVYLSYPFTATELTSFEFFKLIVAFKTYLKKMEKSIKTTENKGGNNKRGYARRYPQGIHICTTQILKIYEDDATTCEFRIYLENLH